MSGVRISEEHRQALDEQRRRALQRPPVPELTEYQVRVVEPEGERWVGQKAHDKNIVDGALCFIQYYYQTNMHDKPSAVVTRTLAAGRWVEVVEPVPEQVYISDSPIHLV